MSVTPLTSTICVSISLIGVLGWASVDRLTLYSDAEAVWRQCVANQPDSWIARNALGLLLMDRAQYDDAALQFAEATRLAPNRPAAHFNLATCYLRTGRFAMAADQFAAGIKLRPNDADGHNSYGLTLAKLGHSDDAITEYRAALAITGDCTDAWLNLLDALAQQNRRQDVETVLTAGFAYAKNKPSLEKKLHEWQTNH